MAKKQENTTQEVLQFAIGRRKRAVAKVRMYSGKGTSMINGKNVEEYVPSKSHLTEFMKPMAVAGMSDDHYFTAKVVGGGIAGQLEAVRMGVARCIAKVNEDMKSSMRKNGLLTRDSREKERKKVYHVRARKSPQFSKR